MRTTISVFVLVGLVLFAIGEIQCGQANAQLEKQFESARQKLIKAQKLEVLYALEWKSAREPRVVAGPTFFQMPIDGKEGFVETVNLYLVGGDKGSCVDFDVLHWQTGKAVGRFSRCRFTMN